MDIKGEEGRKKIPFFLQLRRMERKKILPFFSHFGPTGEKKKLEAPFFSPSSSFPYYFIGSDFD